MERCSYFIRDKALFGSFPTQDTVNILEEAGVRYFINLTTDGESKTVPYQTQYVQIKYPIADRKTPEDWRSFSRLILQISRILHSLKFGEKIYIHCKGGHGRSGILVACILCYHMGMNPEEALRETVKCHSERPEMREKWRRLGSPQGKRQKEFVCKFFRPIILSKKSLGYTTGFHNLSNHPIQIENVGIFPNSWAAFCYYKYPSDVEYTENLKKGIIPTNIKDPPDWDKRRTEIMRNVLQLKFSQNKDLFEIMLRTGLRPFIRISSDRFWGLGPDGKGENVFGKLLESVRESLLDT